MGLFTSRDLVIALNRGNYSLANVIYNEGIRLTFAQQMIDYAKADKNINLLLWIEERRFERFTIKDLKWAFQHGNEKYISLVWRNCPEPDLIDLVDILEIIVRRDNYLLLELLAQLRDKPLIGLFNQVHRISNNCYF